MAGKTAILCSYGPKRATQAALRRLRAMMDRDDQVILYAGTRSGCTDAGRTSRVDVIEDRGRNGLLRALEMARDGQVLHLTDGVNITAASMGRLFAASKATGQIVTPWTNDIGTDHYVGPLPTEGNLTEALNTVARNQPEARVRVLRPVCVVGSRSQLIGLVPHHLSYPTAVLRLLHEDCAAVAGAVAAHDGSATDRLAPPVGPEGRPLIVASMIVRNEEAMLEECLRSLEGLVDRIDLCDTGSTDRTLDIAREYGCNIIEREWRNDFGWARNQVLELSQDAWWALWIDADERAICDDPTRIRRELATGVDHFDSFGVTITSDRGGHEPERVGPASGSRWTTPRILSTQSMHYVGALHEQLMRRGQDDTGISIPLEGLELVHLGYSDELIEQRGKVQRNLDISRKAFEEDPSNATAALHFARSLWLSGAPPEERIPSLEIARDGLEDGDAPTRAFVIGLLAQTVVATGDMTRAMDLARESLDLVPAENTAFGALLGAGVTLGLVEEVLERVDAYAHGPSLRPKIEDPAERARNRAEIVRLLRNAGRIDEALQHTSELLTESHQDFPHWELLIDSLLDSRSAAEFVRDAGHLLTSTEDGGWARPLATRVKSDLALGLIEAHLQSGGMDPEPVRVGLTLAMVTGDEATLERLAREHGHLLNQADREAMAARLRQKGMAAPAELLATQTAPAAPTFLL